VDGNPCTIIQPCATFAHAYMQVVANGIVTALDPGKYGALTISGPVTIDGNGWASITAPANAGGVTINAQPNDKITLKGLNIDGVGSAADGVLFTGGGGLNILDCTIKNMVNNGVYVDTSGALSLLISNTFITNINSVAASSGIYINSAASTENDNLVAILDHVTISDSNNGISIYTLSNPLVAMITDSKIIGLHNGATTDIVAKGTTAFVVLTFKNVEFAGPGSSIAFQGNTGAFFSQVTESELFLGGLGYSMTQTDSASCDGTNHVSFSCGTWSSK
jgi:hypothetical protein